MMGATNKENKMLNCSLSSGQGSYPKRDWMRTVMATTDGLVCSLMRFDLMVSQRSGFYVPVPHYSGHPIREHRHFRQSE